MTALTKFQARSALILALLGVLAGCGGGGSGGDGGDGGAGPGTGNTPTPVTVNLGDDRLLEEGSDGGTTIVEFEVTLDAAATDEVTVEYTAVHDTTEDNDLNLVSGTVRFAPGETAAVIAIDAVADTAAELNEDFLLQLANPSGNATIGDGEAIGRLINDDPLLVVMDLINLGNFDLTSGQRTAEFDYSFFLDFSDFGLDEFDLPFDIYFTSDVHLPFPIAGGTIRILASETNHSGRILIAIPEDFGFAIDGGLIVVFDWSALADGLPEVFLETTVDVPIEADDVDSSMVMLSVTNAVLFVEGDTGETTDLVFDALLSEPLDRDLVLNYETVDRTATSPQDYVATSGSVTIPAGEVEAEFTVVGNGDDEVEGSVAEHFRVMLGTDSSRVILDFPWTEGYIYDDEDDNVREIRFGNAELTEGDSGTADMVFVATLDAPAVAPVTFRYATRDDTAEAGSDYTETSGEATFLPGESELTIAVPIFGDEQAEDDERFFLEVIATFNNGIGVGDAIGTILTDEPIIRVSVGDSAVAEGDAGDVPMPFTVMLSEPSDVAIDIGYATADGTAEAGSDYTAANSTLTILAGETSGLIEVAVTGDTDVENDELLELTITTSSADVELTDDVGTGTILNDDEASGWSGAELVHQASTNGFADQAVLPRSAFGIGAERHVVYIKNFALWHTTSSVPGAWEDPVQIAPIDSEDYASPLTVDDAGRALVVVPNEFLEAHSFAQGSGWQSEPLPVPVEVDGTPRLVGGPATGQSIAIWQDEPNATNGFSRSVWAARFTAQDGWQEVGLVEQAADATFNPDVAMVSNGDGIAVFSQGGDIVAYHLAGGNWQGPRIIDGINTEIADKPRIDMNGAGNAAVAWHQEEPVASGLAVRSIYASRYDAASDAWIAPVLVEENRDTQAEEPDVAIDSNGNVFVVWLQRAAAPNGSRHDLYGNRYDAATGQWSEPRLLELDNTATSAPISEHQVVADDLGNAIVVWLQSDGTQQNLRTTRYSSDDGDWEPATFLEENDSGDAFRPHLNVDRATGDAMVVWFQQDGRNRDIWANRYRRN